MSRRKTLVTDIDTPDPHKRHTAKAVLTHDTEDALYELATLLLSHRSYSRDVVPIVTKRDSEQSFQRWLSAGVPTDLKAKSARISIDKSREEAYDFLREQFFTLCPDKKPNTKQGRPGWYIPRGMQERIAAGEIIALLLNAAGNKIRDELRGDSSKIAA